jgi:D-alanyl-D-alanine carboxypeptidase/D-alanyl-D-alanine-endopeptidase (penicillin-binding protein 4)
MGELVKSMMKPSNNLAAQLLWLQCGAIASEYPSDAELEWPKPERTTDASRRSMEALVKRLEIPTTEVQLEEGSGLSRANLITPAALVRLMAIMDRQAWSAAWREALPIGGRDGTLRNRFKQGPAFERVIAKTGSLRNVATLSGYVTAHSGQRYAFAVMINQNTEGTAKARGEIDRLIELIAADSTPRESGSSPE